MIKVRFFKMIATHKQEIKNMNFWKVVFFLYSIIRYITFYKWDLC